MDHKRGKETLEGEFLGGISGLLLIIGTIVAFFNIENIQGFLMLVSGMGVLVNGVFFWLKFNKKKYIFAAVLAGFTIALLVLFVVQMMSMEGFW